MAGTAEQTVLLIPVDELHAAANNRVVGNVDDLAASIADLGVLQPLLVEPDPSGGYEVVCGARRLAAAKQAGCEPGAGDGADLRRREGQAGGPGL